MTHDFPYLLEGQFDQREVWQYDHLSGAEPFSAPIETESPENGLCPWCDEPVGPDDRVLPVNDVRLLFHRECLLWQVVGSVAHQEKRCTCFRADGDDGEEGLSKREAARQAAEHYERGVAVKHAALKPHRNHRP